MNRLDMGNKILDDIYKLKDFDTKDLDEYIDVGEITSKEKFVAAKQILLGLAILYIITLVAYLWKPDAGAKLLDVTTVTFPPLATLILAFYFRDKSN